MSRNPQHRKQLRFATHVAPTIFFCHHARPYCRGASISTPSSFAARRDQYGSRNSSRASSTTSACPLAMMSSAYCGSVIKPTAPVAMPASLRMRAANATW